MKPAMLQGLTYVGILELGVMIQEVTDKLRGGNGLLSEFGGILDSIGNKLAPDASAELFKLKEELEDTGADTQTIISRLVEFFKGKNISSEQLRTVFNDVGGEANTTAEQIEIMDAVIGQLSDTGGMTETTFDRLKEQLKNLGAEAGWGTEIMTSLNGVLDEQYYSGATAENAWKSLIDQMNIMSLSTEGVSDDLKNLPKDVNVDVGASTSKFDGKYTLLKKQLKKNGVDVPVITSTTAKIFQKALNKKRLGEGASVEVGVDVGTEEKEFQGKISGFTDNFWLPVPINLSTPASEVQRKLNNQLKGFTLQVDAQANITKKDTSGLNKGIDGFTANIENKTTSGLDKTIGGFTGNIAKKTIDGLNMLIGGFTANISKKEESSKLSKVISGFTAKISQKTEAAGLNKTLSGVTAKVSKLEKASGLKLTISGALSKVGSLISAVLKEDGGVYSNGSWHPVTAFAGGGLPDMGQLFVAREAGPELVGKIGNHTAVMNNDQIVGSVSDGVYRAVLSAMAQTSGNQVSEVHVHLEGDAAGIFRLVKAENDRMVIATGAPALLT